MSAIATRALVRPPPRSYRDFYARRGIAIDLAEADRQHASYVAALASAGLAVDRVAPEEAFPDGVFIEDTGVVWQRRMLVTRMIDWREGEQAGVAAFLQDTHEIVALPDGARLEGGDVMHADDVTYVGITARTNRAGAAALREFLRGRPVIEVPVTRCLHLKTAATWLGNETMLLAPDLVDPGAFRTHRLLETAPGEGHAANTLRVNDALLVRTGFPGTERSLERFCRAHAVRMVPLSLGEFEKGDGSLTCLSIIE